MVKKFSIGVFILLLIFIAPVYATDSIGQARISPASPLYFLKGVREIFELKFAGTIRVRSIRQLEFSIRRIREVKSLALANKQDLIEPTLERYWSHLRELIDILNLRDENLVLQVSEAITRQMSVLQTTYYRVSEESAKRSIRLAIFRISEKFAVSKPAACSFLSKEASSSGLNEVEKGVYAERAKRCFSS